MKQQVIGSLTAALLMSVVSAPLSGSTQQVNGAKSPEVDARGSDAPAPESDLESDQPLTPVAFDVPAQPAADILTPAPESNLMVLPHPLDDRQAATLYLQDIPILTLTGTELNTLGREFNTAIHLAFAAADAASTPESLNTHNAEAIDADLEADPALRATSIGSRLNQLTSAEDFDATQIGVRWNGDTEQYIVTVAEADLIALNQQTILPDTTGDPAEDALQVANRLRRLLGDAEPISEIEGRPQPEPAPQTVAIRSSTTGIASWYGPGFHGRRSASGEVFNQNAMTAAHRTLPFGTRVRVTNLNNNRQVIVRVNDRGPYSGRRVIDLSAAAARAIGLTSSGVGPVQLEVLAD
ncbi:septal ring lytic transglycosylase RlpA family protein [Romeria aff. gracilis LEGE 07310]|uniref:Probable endolytic peptidoglycan transglycosylase RlpA n=1 Tax=Vasconcelosia minhoensis LEGE 07310 TaxID=915328 RepID=A0A8J7DS63_9CYAN|nr:septal ring lytic transglycosylase RlpA family protein [Romeria gracilis]MBE9079744.1 septal ring lytic transglycosylase RlpA family protein [Romeria aff. gracilis LEGE 07310]